MKKTINETYELLEDMATNIYQWPKERLAFKKVVGVVDIDVFSILATQVSLLNRQLQHQQTSVNAIQTNFVTCEFVMDLTRV